MVSSEVIDSEAQMTELENNGNILGLGLNIFHKSL